MRYDISGEIAQTARLRLDPDEAVWASRGSLMAYSRHVDWELRVPGGMAGAIRRSMAGEGLSLTYVQTDQPAQRVHLAANAPGHITVWNLANGPIVTTRGSFLAAWGDDLDITATIARRAGAALFGGAGLFLQRVSGSAGSVLIHGSGDFDEHDLADGEELLVSTGNLAAFAGTVDYDIQGVGGCLKSLFGGEGLFITRLTGPGKVLLQTLKRDAGQNTSG